MPEKVNVIIEIDDGIEIPIGAEQLVKDCCFAVLQEEKFESNAEISVTFVDDETIHTLNKQYRNVDRSTDVLSFPLGDNGIYDTNYDTGAKLLGDIVISVEHAITQAKEYGHSINREIGFLTVHSMLHLLGYDHVNGGEEEKTMINKQDIILTSLGLTRE